MTQHGLTARFLNSRRSQTAQRSLIALSNFVVRSAFLMLISLSSHAAMSAGPPPFIQADHKPQTLVHDGRDRPQVFPEVRWNVVNPIDNLGLLVNFEADAFRHDGSGQSRVDTQLDLRVVQGNRRGRWKVLAPSDRTHSQTSKRPAVVTAASADSGQAHLGITVSFLDAANVTPAAGIYAVTLTGTLSAR